MTNKQKVSFRVLDDAEEELTLIFSFLNSKNTISSLPGPYHNVYDIQKSFKLRFDNITFEEDVNMFPVSPVNSRYSYVPRPILKGSKGTNQPGQQHQYHLSHQQQQQQQQPQPPFLSQQNDPLSSSLRRSKEFASEEKTTSSTSNSFNNSMKHSYDEPTRTSSSTADDLYRYVGLADSKATPSVNESSMKIRDEKKSTIDNIPHPSSESQWEDDRKHPKDLSNAHAGMSAEERLRKLMADMQRQNHFPEHLKPENHRTSGQSHHHQQQQPQQSKETFDDPYYHSNPAISLHDLAKMPVQTSIPSSSSSGKSQSQKSEDPAFFRRSYEGGSSSSNRGERDRDNYHGKNSDISLVDFEKEDSLMKSDPLAAFDIPISKTNPSSSSSAGNKGPIRARHDILANSLKNSTLGPSSSSAGSSSSNPNRSSLTKQAWSSTVPSQPSSMNRPPSPSSARPSSPNMGRGPSSNSSVGSVGSGSGKDNLIVGSGTTTSQKVYRYGRCLVFHSLVDAF
jgi:hypothetical protein